MQAAAAAWLRQNALPLQAAQPGPALDDLAALKALVGQSRILALGQSAYGARAFVELQARVLKFAVVQMGFNVIAADIDVTDAGAINAYIHGADGPTISGYAPVDWRSQEMLNLLAWLRDFNQHHPAAAQLRLVSIGAPPPWQAILSVENYLQGVDEAQDNAVTAAYACLTKFQFTPGDYALQSPLDQVDCWTQLETIYQTLQAKHDQYASASSEAQFQDALANAAAVREGEAALAGGDGVRQQLMAEHVRGVLAQAGRDGRVLLLAHNDFIGARSSPNKTMGALLREQFGGLLVSMALDAELGEFTVLPSPTALPAYYAAPAPPGDSYEEFFQSAGLPFMLVPLRPASPASDLPAWFSRPHAFRSMGETYDAGKPGQAFRDASLPAEFDALLYVHDPCPVGLSFYTYVEPADTDFEDACGTAWQLSSDLPGAYQSGHDAQVAHSGQGSLALQSVTAAPGGSAWLGQTVRAGQYRGQRVRLTAYIKMQNGTGAGDLVLMVGTSAVQPSPVITSEAGLSEGMQDWQQPSIELDVPSTAQTISYGVVLRGADKLWLDDLRLDILPPANPTSQIPAGPLQTPVPIPATAARNQRVGGLSPLAAGKIDLVEGLAIFRMYSAAGPFSVVLQDAGSDASERLFDENGSFNGATAIRIPRTGHYLLNVQASGAWTIQIEQPGLQDAGTQAVPLPQTFTGQGQQVSPLFLAGADLMKVRFTFDGAGNFKVVLLDQAGLNGLTIVNGDGGIRNHLDDVMTVMPPSGSGNYLLYISAGGVYTITVGQ